MYLYIAFICLFVSIFLIRKFKILLKKRNKKLLKFKNKLISKESKIDKIFLRQEEKTSLDPSINIQIDINENEEDILRKANIHRARLAKYKKSKLNGELLFEDPDKNIYKLVKGKKVFVK
tara:strand:- start:6135 stop:6494 length:360 start_codon:yes stop_codon:yes gene_type:complete